MKKKIEGGGREHEKKFLLKEKFMFQFTDTFFIYFKIYFN